MNSPLTSCLRFPVCLPFSNDLICRNLSTQLLDSIWNAEILKILCWLVLASRHFIWKSIVYLTVLNRLHLHIQYIGFGSVLAQWLIYTAHSWLRLYKSAKWVKMNPTDRAEITHQSRPGPWIYGPVRFKTDRSIGYRFKCKLYIILWITFCKHGLVEGLNTIGIIMEWKKGGWPL